MPVSYNLSLLSALALMIGHHLACTKSCCNDPSSFSSAFRGPVQPVVTMENCPVKQKLGVLVAATEPD